jgi:hypothetical protein
MHSLMQQSGKGSPRAPRAPEGLGFRVHAPEFTARAASPAAPELARRAVAYESYGTFAGEAPMLQEALHWHSQPSLNTKKTCCKLTGNLFVIILVKLDSQLPFQVCVVVVVLQQPPAVLLKKGWFET